VIVEWLWSLAAGFVGWIASLFENIELPDWLPDGSTALAGFLESASGLGAWFPWEIIALVFAGLVTVYLVAFGIKLVLKVAAFIPFIGGSG